MEVVFVSILALVKEKGSVALLKDPLHSSNGVVPVLVMMQLKEVLVTERDVDALLRDVVNSPDR